MSSSDVTYIDERQRVKNGRPLGSVVNEAKDEFREFAQTRVAMLVSELRENMHTLKSAAPMIGVGVFLAVSGWFALTGALIALIWAAFAPNPYAPFLAFLIVGGGYLIVGGILATFGYSSIRGKSIAPKRTIQVLKEDRNWFQNEARTKL